MKRGTLASLFLVLALTLSLAAPASAAGTETAAAQNRTAQYVFAAVPAPQVGSIGGEWAIIGLAGSGAAAPEGYFDGYYAAAVKYVKARGGVLSGVKYSEYSRVVLALTAVGRDPENVGGFDLVSPLCDYDKVIKQGLNGPVFALLALDSGAYAQNTAPREKYLSYILGRALPGGGWSASGTAADPDLTAMALQALAKYSGRAEVSAAIKSALSALSAAQKADGGFSSAGAENSESVSQVVTALCMLGISPDDSRFVKNGKGLLDCLLGYEAPGGGFRHVTEGDVNEMATEQALCALDSVMDLQSGGSGIYRMSGRAPAIAVPPVKNAAASFSDISADENKTAIEALASRCIISGTGNGLFTPDRTVTRAELAAMTVKAMGLTPVATGAFSDVPSGAWYARSVDCAASYGIVRGTGGGKFSPNAPVTRQEAAVMLTKAAKLAGMDTAVSDARSVLAAYPDGASAAPWARDALAFCLENGALGVSRGIRPAEGAARSETAGMIYGVLRAAKLI
jgi:hypothetical protein